MPTSFSFQPFTWILTCTALVMLMQAGFTCLETGLVRAKNSINVAIKNVVDFCLSSLIFWTFGYGLMYGESAMGWFGTSQFLFDGGTNTQMWAFFLFQLTFCGTATTIISGAVAERMYFSGYLLVSLVISAAIYPVIGHWIWGGQCRRLLDWMARALRIPRFCGSHGCPLYSRMGGIGGHPCDWSAPWPIRHKLILYSRAQYSTFGTRPLVNLCWVDGIQWRKCDAYFA